MAYQDARRWQCGASTLKHDPPGCHHCAVSIAFFPNGDPELEAYGVRLLNRVSRQLREAFDPPELTFAPVGPDFDYASCPELFGGRRGRGPLTVVWDTNLLIDYFQHGRALWKDEPLPDELGDYGDELEALQLIVAVWVIRELRFHILPRVLVDAKRKLSQKRRGERINALENFAAALRLVGSEHEPASARSRARSLKSNGGLRRVLAQVPSTDRPLVADAVELDAHVFLTRDRGVLACKQGLRPFGLLIATPADLLEQLAAYGALHCLLIPNAAYWPLPDQARVTHMINALPAPT
jgi:hypothetical protein